MLIAGAKGFAIQLADILDQLKELDQCVFYDDTEAAAGQFLSRFPVLHSLNEAADYLAKKDNRFTLGTGKPALRKHFFDLFTGRTGKAVSVISPYARIGNYDVAIGEGCSILTNAVVESTVQIGKGTLINVHTSVTHGCQVGDFCELCPGVRLCGDVTVGPQTFIGTGAVVLPKVKIGEHVVIGAGAVVTKDVPSNSIVKGVPGVHRTI